MSRIVNAILLHIVASIVRAFRLGPPASDRAGGLAVLYAFGLFTGVLAHVHPTVSAQKVRSGWSRAADPGETPERHTCPACVWWQAGVAACPPASTPLVRPPFEAPVFRTMVLDPAGRTGLVPRGRGPPLA